MHPKLIILVLLSITVLAQNVHCEDESLTSSVKPLVKVVKGKKLCDKGWECKGWSAYCCNHTISDYFQSYQFEDLFSKRNAPVAHAVDFWDYHSFITAAAEYQPHGFGTTGGKLQGMKEVSAFLGHVGSKTSCGYGVATGGPLAWGLCYNKEMSPDSLYCDDYYKYTYPCAPGASYHGRGALPLYWNYNYGETGEALKVDLLNHPEYIEQNATLAFQAAIWRWMTPVKKNIPSAHDVFVGKWKPTKNDTLAKRIPGFGTTMNVLYGEQTCGQGDVDSMNNIVSHYLYYLDLIGVGREEAGPHDVLNCAEQEAFERSSASNYNYGETGEALKVDLLNHPEYIEQNATLAFQAAIWRWMTPVKKNIPSAHDVFVGKWKPTKNDTLAKRIPGFGTTMNVLYGEQTCGQGDVDSMNNIVSHYLYYLDLIGVGREEAGPHDVLNCAEQEAFERSSASS